MSDFICPVCGGALTRNEKTYSCGKAHSFDISKSGYVNLLLSSGKGKRQHTDEKKDDAMILEPIRFRYSTESIVEEAAAPSAPTAPAEEAPQKPRRRRRPEKKDAPRAEEENSQPKAPREPREQKQPQAAGEAAAPQADEEKKPRRRNNHRRYRKPKANPDTPKD